ncbi:hypothetical protein CDAR_617331 [Caerostris darwini]|uniref:Uncharacterized protein n=1 Tax=Caerostris darwini TaxID=1538125 RepID=A0AAV4X0C6_9ARAC|nr:hypothetical protein CDAR_617331 [Caerostris darwini]
MIDDPETFNDMKHLLIIARNIYGPIATEMLQSRSFAHRGYNYRISQSRIDAARYQFSKHQKAPFSKSLKNIFLPYFAEVLQMYLLFWNL